MTAVNIGLHPLGCNPAGISDLNADGNRLQSASAISTTARSRERNRTHRAATAGIAPPDGYPLRQIYRCLPSSTGTTIPVELVRLTMQATTARATSSGTVRWARGRFSAIF